MTPSPVQGEKERERENRKLETAVIVITAVVYTARKQNEAEEGAPENNALLLLLSEHCSNSKHVMTNVSANTLLKY